MISLPKPFLAEMRDYKTLLSTTVLLTTRAWSQNTAAHELVNGIGEQRPDALDRWRVTAPASACAQTEWLLRLSQVSDHGILDI